MRTAALPIFRKLYGTLNGPFKKGDKLVFNITANYEVDSFNGLCSVCRRCIFACTNKSDTCIYLGKKSLVISTLGEFGGQNPYLGVAYIAVGSACLFFGLLFSFKQIVFPRQFGDVSLLPWDK